MSVTLLIKFLIILLVCKYAYSWKTIRAFLSIISNRDDNIVKDEFYELSLSSTVEIIKKFNYPVEIYKVETEDGYILEMHRIPGNKNNRSKANKPPVFLMHGIQCDSSIWLLEKDRFGFKLADQGYDVWLGNARGNTYSRAHKYLNTSSSEFWNFSFHEIGVLDLPAMIDHVLEITGHNSLYYVSSSQGTATSYVLLSKRPEYNEKMRLVVSLMPVLCIKNSKSFHVFGHPITQIILQGITYIFGEMGQFVNINKRLKVIAVHELWQSNPKQILAILSLGMGKMDMHNYNNSLIPVALSHLLAGASLKQFKHFGQIVRTGVFGEYLEIKEYWSGKVKPYNLTKITAPVALFYAKEDNVVVVEDAEATADSLPNVVYKCLVSNPTANHAYHLIGNDVDETVNQPIISLFNKF